MTLRPLALVLLTLGGVCTGQQVGSRDLTSGQWRVPANRAHPPSKEICPVVIASNSDGAIVPADPHEKEHVQISIAEVLPTQLQIGERFELVVRFINLGKSAVRVPWEPDGERVQQVSADGKEESYEVVDLSVDLDQGGGSIELKAAGALFDHPSVPSSFLDVPPGAWVEAKISGTLKCGLSGALCGKFQADTAGKLTAEWYQRELVHRINGCNEDYGNFVVRELKSDPIVVMVDGPSDKRGRD